ncbi:hypothetical protein CAPTEDRAFT_96808, partial [Capitella teleta]
TLSSKFFSTFPHGTCSLSDLPWYLALDGVYHPLWAAFSNNPTPETGGARASGSPTGLTPSMARTNDHEDLDRLPPAHYQSLTPQFPPPIRTGDSALGSSRFTRRY